ncbi:DUF6221 family protein [Kitasatospora sp. NPDC057223]|uniref:DUF6221 family protein n=1 Tax=Kitasatospora sp. NPDC057223 TaxID=3346055 RepID=UPI00363B50A4
MNLHEWITSKVNEAEAAAKQAAPGPWEATVDDHGRKGIEAGVWAGGIDNYVVEVVVSGDTHIADAHHIARHSPNAILRRCEADRRVLARHRFDPDHANFGVSFYATCCEGCGYGDCGPNVENLDDCPELIDLAHAHGITADELASLDRPEAPPYVPTPVVRRSQSRMTADQAPATFRP